MIQDCRKAGNPPLKFEEIGGSFSVTLPLKESIRGAISKQEWLVDLNKLTARQKKILNILKAGPLNRQQLMVKMQTTLTDRSMQLELAKLKDIGLIKSEGKAKATIWSVVTIESRHDCETIAK